MRSQNASTRSAAAPVGIERGRVDGHAQRAVTTALREVVIQLPRRAGVGEDRRQQTDEEHHREALVTVAERHQRALDRDAGVAGLVGQLPVGEVGRVGRGVAVLVEQQPRFDLLALLGRHHHGARRALRERHVEDDRVAVARGHAPRHRRVAEQRLKAAEGSDGRNALHHRHADHAGSRPRV